MKHFHVSTNVLRPHIGVKYKVRTKRQTFRKFDKKLADPETGVKLSMPFELKV